MSLVEHRSLVPLHRVEALMGESIDTLSAILRDAAVPARDRADIALRLLGLGLGSGDGAPVGSAEALLPVQFVSIPDFLAAEDHAEVVRIARACQDRFTKATVTTDAPDYREARVLHSTEFPALYESFKNQVMGALPAVLEGLGFPPFAVTQLEMQITAHGHGDFFKVHNDSGAPETSERMLTYVYYFQMTPRRGYSGGGLRLYNTSPGRGEGYDAGQFRDVAPVDNAILFFDSRLMHEVLPVQVASGAFEDGRFTLNGWLRR